jgi:hypothetical protein
MTHEAEDDLTTPSPAPAPPSPDELADTLPLGGEFKIAVRKLDTPVRPRGVLAE